MDETLRHDIPQVSEEENEVLTAPFSEEEVCRCFVNRTIKFIRLSRCSRKTMVASNRHEDLY
jgi:hypothetical protein